MTEAAQSLAACANDPAALLTSARTLLKHQPDVGQLWWLCSKLLTALDPREAAWACVDELRSPEMSRALAAEIPDGSRVCVVGAPVQTTRALRRRGDVSVLVVEVDGAGYFVERELSDAEVECETVEAHRIGAAVEHSDLVIVEPEALGEASALLGPGNVPAIATGKLTHTPVWLVCGPGQRLPERFCQAIVERVIEPATVPWIAPLELLGLGAIDQIITVNGSSPSSEPPEPSCTFTPELL